MEEKQGRRVIIVGSGTLSMHLARELLLRGHEVGIATLRGIRDALHFLRVPEFVKPMMEKQVQPRLYVGNGDVRHVNNVHAWFAEGVPDVVHLMPRVTDDVTVHEISTRLDAILNLQAAVDAHYRKTQVFVHQEASKDLFRRSLQDVEALYTVEHPRMQMFRYAGVSAPGNSRVLKGSLDHLIFAARSRTYKAEDFPAEIGATLLNRWLQFAVRLTENPPVPVNPGVDPKHRGETQVLITLPPAAIKTVEVVRYLASADPSFAAVLPGEVPAPEKIDTDLRDAVVQYYDTMEPPEAEKKVEKEQPPAEGAEAGGGSEEPATPAE